MKEDAKKVVEDFLEGSEERRKKLLKDFAKRQGEVKSQKTSHPDDRTLIAFIMGWLSTGGNLVETSDHVISCDHCHERLKALREVLEKMAKEEEYIS